MSCTCGFGTGTSVCHCAGCCCTFTSVRAFDLHQRLDGDGEVICLDPAAATKRDGTPVFTVYGKTPDGEPVWGGPRMPQEAFTARKSGANTAGPR